MTTTKKTMTYYRSYHDWLHGTEADDILTAGDGDDHLDGWGGNDILNGGGGNDWLYGGAGNDILDGGDGRDRAVYYDKRVPVKVTLRGAEDATVYVDGVAEDTLRNIEEIRGGSGNDVLIGDAKNNTLSGWSGDDILDGGDGGDYLLGWAGNDTIYGGGGDDDLHGHDGDDRLYGGAGNDRLDGFDGNDLLVGGDGDDHLDGWSGNDTLDGGSGADWAYFSNKNAPVTITLRGEEDVTVYVGGIAEDTLRNIENLWASNGDDVLIGDAENNKLWGNDGNDTLDGGSGNDTLDGGRGADLLRGGAGADVFQFLVDLPGHDVILDFDAAAGDRISIRAIEGQFRRSPWSPDGPREGSVWMERSEDGVVLYAAIEGSLATDNFSITLRGVADFGPDGLI
ncbi:calcium-binding protein [Haematospirillum sp. H1815]|uniref:calcium-binding protein n=1 Tax=Haematospirillum sp. H1815 TaxID=2723108 RepID=UPI00143CA3FB|nr:calcium-binding protein [Haematospirillum sp. H1815]NKD78125.1 calcium-binding protein [Haematospirillum sp. H1815]